MRTCFLPEEGETWWSSDFSQQEPRLTVHFAAITTVGGQPLAGALLAVDKYRADPKMSYHKMVAEQTGLEYEKAKTLNLGLIYGMGVKKAAKAMKVTEEQAKEYIAKYHERLPFVRALGKVLDAKVKEKGEFRTLLRRVCRFSLWELTDYEKAKKLKPLPLWRAQRDWAGQPIRRAGAHKELNRLIQGSAADQTKRAMQLIMEAGLGKYMLLQIHDELCFSFPNKELAEKAKQLMEDAVKLEVPVIAELKSGPNWGELK
jgi:DNA polymerase I-like protein with 3'-5' exonuclease and polymerase domains